MSRTGLSISKQHGAVTCPVHRRWACTHLCTVQYACQSLFLSSKHTGSDPEAFWLWPVMAVTASMQPESARILYAGSDFPHPFQFCFSKECMDHIARNRPGSDLDGVVRVWPNTSGLEASRCAGIIGPGFWQDTASPLSVYLFQTRFHSSTDVPDNTVQNQPHPIYFWLIVSGFGQTDPVRKQASVQESSGPLLAKAFRPIRTGSGMFTGVALYQGFYNYCLAWTWFCHTNENAPAMIVNRSRLLSVLLCCRRTETKTGSAGIFFIFVFCFVSVVVSEVKGFQYE